MTTTLEMAIARFRAIGLMVIIQGTKRRSHGLTEPLFLRITRSIKEEYTEETTMAAIKETYYDILHIQKAAGDADKIGRAHV